ncbi:MAG: hypothetical protein NPIRA06_04750 [Nitrospirales bacterium]|nr:MAG: hypothetical protein NPIRA06_04750 [Nitrospirales bacterium]
MARKNGVNRGIVEKPVGSGKWWVRICAGGRERWVRCDSKSQAKAVYGRLKAEAREGRLFEKAQALPFRQLAQAYEETVDANRRGRAGDDRARIQRWVDAFGDQDAKAITPAQVQGVINSMVKEKYAPAQVQNATNVTAKEKRYAPATIHRHLVVLKAILGSAEGLESLLINIRKKVRRPPYNNELLRQLDHGQESALLEKLTARFHPIVLTALNTGLRQGELLGLIWSDVNWSNGMLYIRKTKSGVPRRIPMNSTVQRVLTELQASTNPPAEDHIFPHDARYLRRAFDKAIKAANLNPFRFHDLRHAFASRLATQGANDRTIMELGGWSSPRMLKRYVTLAPAHLWQAVEGLTRNETGSKTGSEEKIETEV